MKTTRRNFIKYIVGGGVIIAVAGAGGYYFLTKPVTPQQSSTTVAFPSWEKVGGLNSPRGLKFGLDGYLYVTEAGLGGSNPATGQQVPPPVGPYTGGKTSRISKISPDGVRTTVADGLPSDQTGPGVGSEVSGVADVEFIGNTLYALNAGGGASHGNADVPNGVFRVNADGSITQVADLSAFLKAHPVANPEPNDFEPDGTWYSMTHIGNDLFVIEPNHGELDKISFSALGTDITRVADISASQGHVVPTSMAVGPDGNFYVGDLTPVPFTDGAAKIFKITTDGNLSVFQTGLTTVLGVAFDNQGRLYALETTTGNLPKPPFMVPGSGKVVRLSSAGSLETVASGLAFPTAMTFGPDGRLYVSNKGFGFKEGEGEIIRVSVS